VQADAPLLLSTVDPDGESQVLTSTDQGQRWTTRSTNAAGELYTSLLVAPSDVARVFASGARVNRQDNTLERLWARSSNGGTSFQHVTVPRELIPLGVHPSDPQVLFAYEPVDDLATSYRVLRSVDGGDAFTTVLEGLSNVSAFSASAEGGLVWIGAGRQGGLYESRDGGASFVRVHEEFREVHCLQHRLGRLWLCGNLAPNLDGIWVSKDMGGTFEQVLTFDQVREPVACSPAHAQVCEAAWRDWVLELFDGNDPRDHPDAGVPDGAAATPDAGPGMAAVDGASPSHDAGTAPAAAQSDGAGCALARVAERNGTAVLSSAFLMLALAVSVRRRNAARIRR
jgi:hypothetical protein